MMPPRLFLCNGAIMPRGTTDQGRTLKVLDTAGSNANVHLLIDNVARAYETLLSDRIIDLLEIAAYVYSADCACPRTGAWVDDHTTEQWCRDIKMVIAVRDIEFWSRPDVRSALKRAIDFMMSDTFSFEFVPLKRSWSVQPYLGTTRPDESLFYEVDRITLFSGGLDSLAGAAQAATRGETLALVSHRPVQQTDNRQTGLVAELRKRFNVPIQHNPVWVNKTKIDRESSQRSRVFLFACLAGAVASVLKAKGIRFYENGVISLNWPLADEALLSRASRTTHSETLHRLQILLAGVLDYPDFVIEKPVPLHDKVGSGCDTQGEQMRRSNRLLMLVR